MIWWGSGGDVKDMGQIRLDTCQTCERQRPFHVFCLYKFGHVYGFRYVTSEEYLYACSICKKGYALDKEKAHAAFGDPIGGGTRYGCLIGFAVIMVLGLLGQVFGSNSPRASKPLVASAGSTPSSASALAQQVAEPASSEPRPLVEGVPYSTKDSVAVQLVKDLEKLRPETEAMMKELEGLDEKRAPMLARLEKLQGELDVIDAEMKPLRDDNDRIDAEFKRIQSQHPKPTKLVMKEMIALDKKFRAQFKVLAPMWERRKKVIGEALSLEPADKPLLERRNKVAEELQAKVEVYGKKLEELKSRPKL